ncbi:MAG: hypothetical protein E5X09_19860 [Mesorhizobium sp.]|nr:MAG: hypothetical protein E5X09_19860 [Mesorhizobium sp.]
MAMHKLERAVLKVISAGCPFLPMRAFACCSPVQKARSPLAEACSTSMSVLPPSWKLAASRSYRPATASAPSRWSPRGEKKVAGSLCVTIAFSDAALPLT